MIDPETRYGKIDGFQLFTSMMPRCIVVVAASLRSETARFSSIVLTWLQTVLSLMSRALPICLLVSPRASIWRTSSSRAVRGGAKIDHEPARERGFVAE